MYIDAHIAQLAAEELRARRVSAQRLVEAGSIAPARAALEVAPFMAMACRLGADVAELREQVTALRQPRPTIYGTFVDPGETCARAMVADDYCLLPETRAALAKARDRAVNGADGDSKRGARATRLATLAIALGGCSPYSPARPDRLAA